MLDSRGLIQPGTVASAAHSIPAVAYLVAGAILALAWLGKDSWLSEEVVRKTNREAAYALGILVILGVVFVISQVALVQPNLTDL